MNLKVDLKKIIEFPEENSETKEYSEYRYRLDEFILTVFFGFLIGFGLGYLIYEWFVISFIFGIIGSFIWVFIRRKSLNNKRKKEIIVQFKSFLEALGTNIGAGKNIDQSFIAIQVDMKSLYGEDSIFYRELKKINLGNDNGVLIENSLKDFANRTNIDDIMDFADVFSTCKIKGGDIKTVVKKTQVVLIEKMEIEMDIETMVTEKKMEKNIITVMPFIFIIILKNLGGGMIDLNSTVGIASMTVSLLIFLVAIVLSNRILDIKF